ncbi:Protein of unknown function (DUF3435) domain containing protein [Elaphomyces granulatus]
MKDVNVSLPSYPSKFQPVVNVDDLLYLTYHTHSGTLVESTGYIQSNDCLKYKDLELYMIKNPNVPTCKALVLRVKHRLNKGKRSIFPYIERNDNLGLCVIQDILEYAFEDNVFSNIWRYIGIPNHRLSVPIHFKDSKKEVLVFRQVTRDDEGNWVTGPLKALTYATSMEDERRLCKSAGLKDLGTLYKYRYGANPTAR